MSLSLNTAYRNNMQAPHSGCACDGTGARAAVAAFVREAYTNLVGETSFIERALAHMVNHRVQDFQDPLTSTLVLMATSPLQMVMCEAGLLPFKTNLLPVIPYALLTAEERQQLQETLAHVPDEQLHDSIEASGQYTLTVLPFTQNVGSSPTVTLLCKRRLLHAFVRVLLSVHASAQVGRTLCNIVLQRFMAQVPTSSDIVSSIMAVLQPSSQPAVPAAVPPPPLSDPSPPALLSPQAIIIQAPCRGGKEKKRDRLEAEDRPPPNKKKLVLPEVYGRARK